MSLDDLYYWFHVVWAWWVEREQYSCYKWAWRDHPLMETRVGAPIRARGRDFCMYDSDLLHKELWMHDPRYVSRVDGAGFLVTDDGLIRLT